MALGYSPKKNVLNNIKLAFVHHYYALNKGE